MAKAEYRKHAHRGVRREAMRRCLRCGENFLSESPANRICGECRYVAEPGVLALQAVDDSPKPRQHGFHLRKE